MRHLAHARPLARRRAPEPPVPHAPWGGVRRPPPLALVAPHIGNHATARAVARFESNEHAEMGDQGSGGAEVELAPGFTIGFGEMTAMAGDYFGSLQQMRDLAAVPGSASAPYVLAGTSDELTYILHVHVRDDMTEDQFGPDVVAAADARANLLVADNASHYTNPEEGDAALSHDELAAKGSANNAGSYRDNHESAIEAAVSAGSLDALAMGNEGFAGHYLTDAYSAGHLRTPRTAINELWNERVPMFWTNLKWWLAEAVTEGLVERSIVPADGAYVAWRGVLNMLESVIADKGVPPITFGDVVGGAVHDLDGETGVQAQVGDRLVTLVGDGEVLDEKDRELARGSETLALAAAGVKASLADLTDAAALSQRGTKDPEAVKAALKTPDGLYRAEQLWPKAVPEDQLPEDQRLPAWDVATVDELLADPRMQDALKLFANEKADTFADLVQLEGMQQMLAEPSIIAALGRLKQEGPELIAVFREIIDYTPGIVTGGAADGGQLGGPGGVLSDDNARAYYLEAKEQGALHSLTLEQRTRLIRLGMAGPTLAGDQQMIADLVTINDELIVPILDEVGWRSVWQSLGAGSAQMFVGLAAEPYWSTQTYGRKREEVAWLMGWLVAGDITQDTVIAILETCSGDEVRQIDDEAGGLLGLATLLTGEHREEFERLAAAP